MKRRFPERQRTGSSRLLPALLLGAAGTSCEPAASDAPWLEEITASSGVRFVHDPGAAGRYLMPEILGSGCAVLDADGDARLDLYFVQHGGPSSSSTNRLYLQLPDGTFRDATEGSGLGVAGHGMGAIAGDVTNDGLPEIVVTEVGAVRLFHNRGDGLFAEVTAEAGIEGTRWATAASFLDLDRDGWLDLAIGNYVDYTASQECRDARGRLEYCGPQGLQGTAARLFRNLGGATPRFEDITVRSGLARATGPALGILCADLDGDRWPDIFLADDGRPNRLFINGRDGTFREEAAARGLAHDAMGGTAGNMGVAAGDVDGNGLIDLFVTHLDSEQHTLWMQGPRGSFLDRTAAHGLAAASRRGTGFGTVLADFDLDGVLDLAFVNGRVLRGPDAGPFVPGVRDELRPYAQRPQLLAGDDAGSFRDLAAANAAFCGAASVGRGLAMADLDEDGDIDLAVTGCGGPAQLFRNVAQRRGHWLVVRAVDPTRGGRDAYGAEVVVEAGGRSFRRLVQPSSSYLASHDPRACFGLGNAAAVTAVRVAWPDGSEEVFPGGSADRRVTLEKGRGAAP